MLRGLLVFFFVLVQLLFGRENPFVPSQDYKGVDAPTNVVVERGDFEQQALSLPSNARVLKYVVFGYQTLNGDVEQMRMEIDKNVDWHDPMVVTKESVLINPPLVTPPMPNITSEQEIASTSNTSEESLSPETSSPVAKLETNSSKPVQKNQKIVKNKDNSVTVGFEELIGFEAFSKRILIVSDDKLIRHFMIADPYKVVLDFEKDAAFYTQYLPLNHGAFKQITLGNHNGYYRAAISLDGHYIYEIKPIQGGYEVILK